MDINCGDSALAPSVLVQHHRHAMTRFVWDIVSSETFDADTGVLKALFEKSMITFRFGGPNLLGQVASVSQLTTRVGAFERLEGRNSCVVEVQVFGLRHV